MTSLRPAERRALLFGALLLWSLVLALETRFGGAGGRAALAAATLALLVAATPWGLGLLAHERSAPMLVVAPGSVTLRGEPLEARAAVGELGALEEVERLDELPGWVRVERADGLRGWVRAETLFPLRLGNG